jgi:SNF2 family DNA or RNA helicase
MSAERTKAVRQWAGTTNRVLFLTGTPMENRVEEFQVLVSHLRPDLMLHVNNVDGLIGAGHFRTSVAPVYLRRNQSDVLEELPPRVGIEDWVELRARDLDAYRHAVAAGNFMAMRRAAYAPGRPADSAKLGRLVEIVEEPATNGRKVVVFSYFREVLDTIAAILGGPVSGGAVFGPLTSPRPW